MVRCPSCAHEAAPGARFCSRCAAALDPSSAETAVMSAAARSAPVPLPPPPSTPSLVSSGVDEGRFLPGAIVAGRYRIAGLLGRGGMGEVYRATDLTLSQAVALKFLPESASRDERAIARFYNEVRMARQVTHPNVCRVYDIGEIDGQHYISMEYVDGEDLATLLRRIGRMPSDRAVEVARKLCAGLAAAHEKSVLHRDLKPANVMIDGRGNVVIMDFGLAGISEQLQSDIRSGTPAYMSPEQLAGAEVTTRSDIYALGLVMYELFTGKRAFEAASLMELMDLQHRAEPASVCSVAKDLDPKVERVILRCLDPAPARRPPTAQSVAISLGGDALAAALAAGETPSPELIAAAGESEGLRPKLALAWLAAALALIFAASWLEPAWSLNAKIALDVPPDALARDARKMLDSFGYAAKPRDTAYGFDYADAYLRYLRQHPEESRMRWQHPAEGQPPLIHFWYRQSPAYMTAQIGLETSVTESDPPPVMSGLISLRTDPAGRLTQLEVATPQRESPVAPAAAYDWTQLFRAAGLEMGRFQPAEPIWTPLASFDARAAWTGIDPATRVNLRVEAAAWRGRPVFFRILGPWSQPERMEAANQPDIAPIAVIYLLLAAACSIAWHNFRTGHGDRRGANKLFVLAFAAMFVGRMIQGHHAPVFDETNLVWKAISIAGLNAAALWVFYIALEPWVRRRWPETLISWSRFTTKGLRDPHVGRDILYGVAIGSLVAVLKLIQLRLHGAAAEPPLPAISTVEGLRSLLAFGFNSIFSAIFDPMLVLFLLFLMRVLFRERWIAAFAVIAVLAVLSIGSNGFPMPAVDIPALLLLNALEVLVILRFGIPAMIAAEVVTSYLIDVPMTLDFSSWYAATGLLPVAVAACFAWYGFRTALAGRAVWGDEVE